jgi:hypothetical protein
MSARSCSGTRFDEVDLAFAITFDARTRADGVARLGNQQGLDPGDR